MSETQTNRHLAPWRLVINQPSFLRQARRLLVDHQHFAVGRVRRRTTRQARELVVDQWQPDGGTPSGLERPPLMDWAVLGVANSNCRSLEAMLEMVQPKRSQLVVLILLEPDRRSRFPAAIWQSGSSCFPKEVHFIGSRMIRLRSTSHQALARASRATREMADGNQGQKAEAGSVNRSSDIVRASRTLGVLGLLYRQLGEAQVVLVGAGGGGQELARQLVAAGVRRLTIIDGDVLAPENLDRRPLARAIDVGQAKVVQLARSLNANQPAASIRCLPRSVMHSDATRLCNAMRADVLFSYVDSNVARMAVSLLAREMETIHIDVGSSIQVEDHRRVMSGDIRLFEPGRGCVACVPEMDDLGEVLYHLSAPAGSLQRGHSLTWDEQRAGSLLHLNAVVSAQAVETWLAWLKGEIGTSHWTRLRWANLTPEYHSSAIGPGLTCRFCADVG